MAQSEMTGKRNTNRHLACYNFILSYWKEHKTSPSTRELADSMNTSTSVINYYLRLLQEDGYILWKPDGLSRQIIPVEIAQAIEEHFADID